MRMQKYIKLFICCDVGFLLSYVQLRCSCSNATESKQWPSNSMLACQWKHHFSTSAYSIYFHFMSSMLYLSMLYSFESLWFQLLLDECVNRSVLWFWC